MKLTWLRGRNPGGRVGMLMTGTPVTNSLAELHVLFRYCAPEILARLGLTAFDAFAGAHIKYATQTEVDPGGGGFRSYRRPRLFVNLPELRSWLWQFADIRNRADLNLQGPRVAVEHVAVPAQPEMGPYTATLVDRADAIRDGAPRTFIRPDGEVGEDNMLSVCNDGRAAALDLRLVGIEPTGPGKVEECARRAAAIYHATRRVAYTDHTGELLIHPRPGSGQLIFCDLGTPRPGDDQVYGRLRDFLVKFKVRRRDIEFAHDAKSHADRAAQFARCRSGECAILIASTEKAGMGVNVQNRLIAIHHLDAPWTPAWIEQRDGRGDRPGNENSELRVYRYVTEGSFDAYMWQALYRKAQWIAQILTGDPHVREAEAPPNPQVLSYGELMAISTGQPLLMMLSEVEAEIARLRNSSAGHKRAQRAMTSDWKDATARAAYHGARAAELEAITKAATTAGEERILAPERFRTRLDTPEAVAGEIESACWKARENRCKVTAGKYRGVHISFDPIPQLNGPPVLGVAVAASRYSSRYPHEFNASGVVWVRGRGGVNVLGQVDAEIDRAAELAAEYRETAALAAGQAAEIAPYLEQEWPHKAELAAALARRAGIEREINAQVKDSRKPAAADEPEQVAA